MKLFTSKRNVSIFTLILLAQAAFISSCKEKNPAQFGTIDSFECSFEKVSDKGIATSLPEVFLLGNQELSTAQYRSGESSLRLSKGNVYGAVVDFEDLAFPNAFEISMWRLKSAGDVVLMITGYHYQEAILSGRVDGDWEEWILKYKIKEEVYDKDIRMQVQLKGEASEGFVDDLVLQVYNNDPYPAIVAADPDLEILSIDFETASLQKLSSKRDSALIKGVLESADDDWVVGMINNSDSLTARLKGDWTDHLKGEKWSMRLKLQKGHFWKRMGEFSIQSPATRNMMSEWILHKWFKHEDILTTRYFFQAVSINDQYKGIYGVEEHFTKQLLETQNRREGPILKWNEDHLWAVRAADKKNEGFYPFFEAAEIEAYSIKRYKRSPALRPLLDAGRNLMWSAQHRLLPAEEIYDLGRMAKFYAIQDLMKAYHGGIWHNIRTYYNPISARLEPIGFDGDSQLEEGEDIPILILQRIRNGGFGSPWEKHLYENQQFVDLYLSALTEMSKQDYITAFLEKIEKEYTDQLSILQSQFAYYDFDLSLMEKRAGAVRTALKDLETPIGARAVSAVVPPKKGAPLKAGISVICYERKVDSLHKSIAFANYSGKEVVISQLMRNKRVFSLEKPVRLPAYQGGEPPVSERIVVAFNPKYFLFQTPEDGLEYRFPSIPLTLPKSEHPRQGLLPSDPTDFEWLNELGNEWIVKKGVHTLEKALVVPAGKLLAISKGTTLDLTNGAFVFSESAVVLKGTPDEKINIKSSDGNNSGFTVMQTELPNVLEHVAFMGLSNFSFNGRTLTGAVNFYEANVKLSYCSFLDNRSEDGLNIIRSRFTMDHCAVSNTTSDGFDADFCQGTVSNCEITKTGNDGLDFSGSKIEVLDCTFSNIGDKALSVGEASTVDAANLTISEASIALTAKDLSKLRVDKLSIANCDYKWAAYQKKPEYGPASIELLGELTIEDAKEALVEKGSWIIIAGKKVGGELDLDIAGMYARFEK